jgi:hypothetical protein
MQSSLKKTESNNYLYKESEQWNAALQYCYVCLMVNKAFLLYKIDRQANR